MAFSRQSLFVSALGAGMILSVTCGLAAAADLPTTKAPPAPPPSWWSTVTINGEVDAGIMENPDNPGSGLNWGRLFDDKANTPEIDQTLITIQRPTDPNAKGYDIGFALQGFYGTDARYTHYLGICDYCINARQQVDVTEAYLAVHTPWLFDGGIDFKGGLWPTLEGAEVIDPAGNLFYSHSYIFNYAEPFKDTGILGIAHVNPTIDVYAGVSTGSNTTFGAYSGDNNNAPAFEGGIGLNKLFGGSVTVLATTHIGPESPYQDQFHNPIFYGGSSEPDGCQGFCGNSALTFMNDLVVTWNATDKITIIGEGNYTRFSSTGFDAYGAVGYISYQTPIDWLKINGRAEVYRDDQGEFVGAYPNYFDFVNVEHGYSSTAIFTGVPTTYLELTAGVNITPTVPSTVPLLKGLIIRPEIRYDDSLNGTTPFDLSYLGYGTKSSSFTFGGDVILKF